MNNRTNKKELIKTFEKPIGQQVFLVRETDKHFIIEPGDPNLEEPLIQDSEVYFYNKKTKRIVSFNTYDLAMNGALVEIAAYPVFYRARKKRIK